MKLRVVLEEIWNHFYYLSVEQNLKWLKNKLSGQIKSPARAVYDDLMSDPEAVKLYLTEKFRSLPNEIVVFGENEMAKMTKEILVELGKRPALFSSCGHFVNSDTAHRFSIHAQAILCIWPEKPEDWDQVVDAKTRFSGKVLTIGEYLLPLYSIREAQKHLRYRFKDFREIMAYYTGRKFMGPMEELNSVFPVKGKSVIEFGPYDGYQTATLVKFGAKAVTCVEVRAENVIKTAIAKQVFDWENARVVADDFHNVNAKSYGRYDLAFAHGVYYHSFSPFLFLENLCSLSDNIFLGGYVATEEEPPGDFVTLEDAGEKYRAKVSVEGVGIDQGVNLRGYLFHRDDLRKWFERKGYSITELSGEEQFQPTGRYFRFLARKTS